MTNTQNVIYNAVLSSDEHLTAEKIFLSVKKTIPGIALGTIYRNLNLFAEQKIIRRVARPNGPDYFEKNLSPHDHTICISCGRMSDIKIETLKNFMEKQLGCEIVSFDLAINYMCPQCKKINH